jgi:hypothetical protein
MPCLLPLLISLSEKKLLPLFFSGLKGDEEHPGKMKGRVIRPEAGDLIFRS